MFVTLELLVAALVRDISNDPAGELRLDTASFGCACRGGVKTAGGKEVDCLSFPSVVALLGVLADNVLEEGEVVHSLEPNCGERLRNSAFVSFLSSSAGFNNNWTLELWRELVKDLESVCGTGGLLNELVVPVLGNMLPYCAGWFPSETGDLPTSSSLKDRFWPCSTLIGGRENELIERSGDVRSDSLRLLKTLEILLLRPLSKAADPLFTVEVGEWLLATATMLEFELLEAQLF